MNFQQPKWTPKEQKTNWLNLLTHVHDLQCHCDKPLEHTAWNIFEQEKHLRFDKNQKEYLQKCLTTDSEEDGADALDGIGEDALTALFAEDMPDDDG